MPSLQREIGPISYPLPASSSPDFSSLNPARDILLKLFTAAINDEYGQRWAQVADGTRLTSPRPVKTPVPLEPTQELLQQFKAEFPALFVYWDNGAPTREEEFTLREQRYTTRWGIDYILGPLDVGNKAKFQDFLFPLGQFIGQVVRDGGHQAYASQTLPSGQVQAKRVFGPWGAGCCGFSTTQVVEYFSGAAQLERDGPKYWATTVVFEATMLARDNSFSTRPAYQGADGTFGTGNTDGVIEDLVKARSVHS